MRRLLITATLLTTTAACAQIASQASFDSSSATSSAPDSLPDAPSEALLQQSSVVVVGQASLRASGKAVAPCGPRGAIGPIYIKPDKINEIHQPCSELIYPFQRFLNSNIAIPLTWQEKGYLALHDVTDPANLATVGVSSAIAIAADSHSAYGPGLTGFGKIVGVSLSQDATGEFFGIFLIPSLAHQDPRYYRMPHATVPRRLLYALSRTFISRHDDGSPMPNYGTLLAYPISAEIGNLYVPGIETDGPSTAKRIATGLALDPVNNLVAEFLPDLAKRVHVRIIFVQQILNNIASSQGNLP